VACEKCHASATGTDRPYVMYKPLKMECKDCHKEQ
jgi:hypothetical protein